MLASEARSEANRRDALAHLAEDEPATGLPSPAVDWPAFLAEQIGVITARLGRCDALDRLYRARIALRARYHWDDDRRLQAEFLGSEIAGDPAAVARELRMTPHGCDWMIDRWSRLALAADREGSWTPGQLGLAFDLLGTPGDFRAGTPGESFALGAAGEAPAPGELARREVADLLRRKAELAPSDAFARSLALEDAADDSDPELRKLRRHESELHRRLRWCVAQLARAEPGPRPDAEERRVGEALARSRASSGRPDPKLAMDEAREAIRRDKQVGRRG